MCKPTRQEMNHTKLKLRHQDIICCGICFKKDDESTEDYVNWVECLTCDMWVHVKCAIGIFHDDRCRARHKGI